MTIKEYPMDYYITRLKENAYFSFPGFGDSELFCIVGQRLGTHSGFGQLHTEEIGVLLREAIKPKDENYLRAFPKIVTHQPLWDYYQTYPLEGDFYERDMVLDDFAVKPGALRDFIEQLRKMNVYIVSNSAARGLHFLNYKKFFEITSPNYHLVEGGIQKTVDEITAFGQPGVYLFACGMSDAPMISALHGKIKDAFLIDVGSIFDAFVGQGAQREWRQKLYSNPQRWVEWIAANLQNV